MDDPPLASLSLTHVHYIRFNVDRLIPFKNPSDPISYACAWLALVPQALCVTYATLIWSTREAEILLMFAGQMACEALNWMLKRYIKEERPRRESYYPFGSYVRNVGMEKYMMFAKQELGYKGACSSKSQR
ncbi:hypothetical protein LTR50_002313 [Elasticomyces elasticus]|nr:hypothetical protein LTR50_002313 [Elasticomyces elasticus]